MVTGDSGELDQSVTGKREIECISATLVGVDTERKTVLLVVNLGHHQSTERRYPYVDDVTLTSVAEMTGKEVNCAIRDGKLWRMKMPDRYLR